MSMSPEGLHQSPGQLERVWLASVDFAENPAFDFDGVEVAYGARVESTDIETPDDECVLLTIRVTLEWASIEEEAPLDLDVPMDLEMSVSGTFAWEEEDLAQQEKIAWTELNGPYLLWPYVRSYISMVTAASSMPEIVLPTIELPIAVRSDLPSVEAPDA